jgi:hypothetical protein
VSQPTEQGDRVVLYLPRVLPPEVKNKVASALARVLARQILSELRGTAGAGT